MPPKKRKERESNPQGPQAHPFSRRDTAPGGSPSKSDPGRIRTCTTPSKSRRLWPVELRSRDVVGRNRTCTPRVSSGRSSVWSYDHKHGRGWTRTSDLLFVRQALSRLSYSPERIVCVAYARVLAVNVERRGGQFVLTSVEPELRDAANALGFLRNGDAFIRTFPEDARWLDAAWRNFVRHAGEMLRQTASGVAPWDEALLSLLERVDGVDWWLAGSGALAVRGVEVSPRDLDVITDAAGAQRLGELLVDALVEPVFVSDGWVARWWGRAFLGARVEWVAEVASSVDEPDPVDFGPLAAASLERVRWHGHDLRVPPLELQLAVAERRGLEERVEAIKRSTA